MYLYFNKLGILTTNIPHGEIPRQGSTLNVYVCLDSDFFESEEQRKKSIVNIDLILPNDEIGTRKWVTVDEVQLLPFKKKTSNEAIGDFVDNGYYWTYHFKFEAKESTIYAGKVNAAVSIREIDAGNFDEPLDLESIEEIEVKYFGSVDIIVEKTFGSASFNDNISQSHYANISKQINAIVTKLNNLIANNSAVVANPELDGDEGKLVSIMIGGIKYKIDSINQEELDDILKTIKEEIEPQIEEIKENYALKSELEEDYALKVELEEQYKELMKKINDIKVEGFNADYNDLENKPIENEENNNALYISDENGNILARFDEKGLHTVGVSIKNEDILEKIEKVKEEIVFDYNDLENKPLEREDLDDTLYIVDENGNIIARFDKNGFYTTNIHENGQSISLKYASKEDLAEEVAKLVDSSPETLNTLNELAKALGDDPNFATTISQLIGTKLGKNEQAADSAKLGGFDASKFAYREDIIDDYNDLKNKPIENETDDKTLSIVDKNGNIILEIDSGGLHATNIYSNGKEIVLKEMIFTGTIKEYESANANGLIPVGAMVYIIDDEE